MQLLDGKAAAQAIELELVQALKDVARTDAAQTKGAAPPAAPHLVAVLVGNDPASETYVANKVKACERVGIRSTLKRYPADTLESTLLEQLRAWNQDPDVHGVLVQLPLPAQIRPQEVIETIDPQKDVDGFHPTNLGRLALGLPTLPPATPAGILELLRRYNLPTEGKHAVVVGRSNTVGTPTSLLLSRNGAPGNATVTLCHSRTPDLSAYTRKADIVVAAAGRRGLLTADHFKPGAVVIDVGIHRTPDSSRKRGYRLVGDVDTAGLAEVLSARTPVPGGVGPMTIAMLLTNTVDAWKRQTGQTG